MDLDQLRKVLGQAIIDVDNGGDLRRVEFAIDRLLWTSDTRGIGLALHPAVERVDASGQATT